MSKKTSKSIKFTLRQARQHKGLRLLDVGNLVGVHWQTIRNWELGITAIDIKNLAKLCDVYGIHPDSIVIDDGSA